MLMHRSAASKKLYFTFDRLLSVVVFFSLIVLFLAPLRICRFWEGSSYLLHMASEPKQNTSIWLALRNPAFVGLWLPSLVSGVCVSAHDTAATWLLNALGASPLLLSLIATAASLPFFLFTLPAGALADLCNRRNLLIAAYLWLAASAGLLAVCTWLHWVHPYIILTTVFLLGICFAFNAPVWASIVPALV